MWLCCVRDDVTSLRYVKITPGWPSCLFDWPPLYDVLLLFILLPLTSCFAAVIITAASRGRTLTRNVNILSSRSTCVVVFLPLDTATAEQFEAVAERSWHFVTSSLLSNLEYFFFSFLLCSKCRFLQRHHVRLRVRGCGHTGHRNGDPCGYERNEWNWCTTLPPVLLFSV